MIKRRLEIITFEFLRICNRQRIDNWIKATATVSFITPEVQNTNDGIKKSVMAPTHRLMLMCDNSLKRSHDEIKASVLKIVARPQ